MKDKFKEKVQSMTAKEIIMAMVDSLTPPPVINICMTSFGHYETIKPGKKFLGITIVKPEYKCFGCAATNTICKISGITFKGPDIVFRDSTLNTDSSFLNNFEKAIDHLRNGDIFGYNWYASRGNFAVIKKSSKMLLGEFKLPLLKDNYTIEELEAYKQLADCQ
jgi:hypothetical protein